MPLTVRGSLRLRVARGIAASQAHRLAGHAARHDARAGGPERSFPDVYAATTIPSRVSGAARAVPTIGVTNLLLARPDLGDDLARALVDALIDDAPALVAPDALGIQYLTPASLIDTSPIALHPAAERRYRERYG